MPLNETAPRRYQRQFDNIERFLHHVTDTFSGSSREHWAGNIVARLGSRILSEGKLVAALCQAWIHTRYHYPLITAIVDGKSYVYESTSLEQKKSQLSESFLV